MMRWIRFLLCAVLGLALLLCGLLVPAHLRAIDASVVRKAGARGPDVVERGLTLTDSHQWGAARLLYPVAAAERLPGYEVLGRTLTDLAIRNPQLLVWGGPAPFQLPAAPEPSSLANSFTNSNAESRRTGFALEPFTDLIIPHENREAALGQLKMSSSLVAQELLVCRGLTNTTVFSPSASSSGQALDAALAICGLLIQDGQATSSFSNAVLTTCMQARYRGVTEPLEQMLLDMLSLGQRFDWGSLVAFTAHIKNAATLKSLAQEVRNAGSNLPVLFSAVVLSERPARVAQYLTKFSETGMADLRASLRSGTGGVDELLGSQQRLYRSELRQRVAKWPVIGAPTDALSKLTLRIPKVMLVSKWLLYLAGGFFLAMAMHFARPPVAAMEQPLQVRGFHMARETLFAMGFLLVVLLLSEPFLTQGGQKAEFSFRLRLPTAGSVTPAGNPAITHAFMNPTNLITIVTFFVLQSLLYSACLVKLAEIRRQTVPPRMKLKLLENEDHLFDAGLYLGFVGTIISLILASLGMTEFSLMAAYSSTSFGILFVSFFKIVHLRPARRKLLLEAESDRTQPMRAPVTPAFATSP